MLSLQINNIGFVFTVNIKGNDIYFREWSATDDCIYYFPLSTLVDNGNARFQKNECILPFESVYLLDENEQCLLGLPSTYKMSMRLRGEGMLNSRNFSYKLELLSSVPDGELLHFERLHNVVSIGLEKFILSENQYSLFETVEVFNSIDESKKNIDLNLRHFSNI